MNGRWGSTTGACDGARATRWRRARCPTSAAAARAIPGTSRCRADGAAIETCAADGTWTLDRTCLLGRCRPAGPQAECETECAPGEHACAFDGANAERVCDDKGLWTRRDGLRAPDTTCRLSGDVALGCVACVGARAGGGNAFGEADSRCAGAGFETCGADGAWHPIACPDGGTCTLAHARREHPRDLRPLTPARGRLVGAGSSSDGPVTTSTTVALMTGYMPSVHVAVTWTPAAPVAARPVAVNWKAAPMLTTAPASNETFVPSSAIRETWLSGTLGMGDVAGSRAR